MNFATGPVLLLMMMLASPAAVQQPEPVPAPPTVPDELLAFNDNGARMTVPVTIGAAGPYRFIVDTGAERTVISRELAGTLGLARGRDVRVTGMAGVANVGTVVIPMISVGTITGARIEAPAFEYRHLGALGMLGIDTLQNHAVTIDFDNKVMTVTPSTKVRKTRPAAPDEIIVHAKNLFGQLVVTDAFYRNKRIRVIVDTGSVVSMGNLALMKQVLRRRNVQSISLLSVTGEFLQADYTQIDQVKVAGVDIANLPVAFADAAPFKHFGLTDRPALLLGMDALRLFRRVRIDFPNREVRFLLPRDAVRTI
jgi:predicted aspartyl protease